MDRMDEVAEGETYNLRVSAKGARGEGIGRIGSFVVFVRNAKTRIGNSYSVRIVKVQRTFAYAELMESKRQYIGNSILELGI